MRYLDYTELLDDRRNYALAILQDAKIDVAGTNHDAWVILHRAIDRVRAGFANDMEAACTTQKQTA